MYPVIFGGAAAVPKVKTDRLERVHQSALDLPAVNELCQVVVLALAQ